MSGGGRATRVTGGRVPKGRSKDQAFEPAPGAADRIVVPGPGLSSCPVCQMPGKAVIDNRGVKIYHQTPWPCRHRGRFIDLLTTPDPDQQAQWSLCSPGVICPRCLHRRDQHETNEVAPPSSGTPCTGCDCPGPFAVIGS